MQVLRWLHDMLGGTSPKTGYTGSLMIIWSILEIMKETVVAEGLPQTKWQWVALGAGIAARLAKDEDKTNSQHPTAAATTVPKADASPVTFVTGSGQQAPVVIPVAAQVPPSA